MQKIESSNPFALINKFVVEYCNDGWCYMGWSMNCSYIANVKTSSISSFLVNVSNIKGQLIKNEFRFVKIPRLMRVTDFENNEYYFWNPLEDVGNARQQLERSPRDENAITILAFYELFISPARYLTSPLSDIRNFAKSVIEGNV